MKARLTNQDPDGASAIGRRGGVSRQQEKKVYFGVISDPTHDDGNEARAATSGHDDDDGQGWPDIGDAMPIAQTVEGGGEKAPLLATTRRTMRCFDLDSWVLLLGCKAGETTHISPGVRLMGWAKVRCRRGQQGFTTLLCIHLGGEGRFGR